MIGNGYISREFSVADGELSTTEINNKRAGEIFVPGEGSEEFIIRVTKEGSTAAPSVPALDRTGWSAVADSYHNASGPSDGPASNLLDGNIKGYELYYTTDGTTWTKVANGDTVNGTTEITFDPVAARYVKLTATKSYHWQMGQSGQPDNRNTVMTVAEFEVFKAVVTFTNWDGKEITKEIPGTEFVKNGGYYVITVEETVIADGRLPIHCVITDAEGNVVAEVTDSIASYADRTTKTPALYEAIMKFSDSALAYLETK